MPASPDSPFQYAVLRVVPDVQRGERLNAGVVLYAPTRDFLGARVRLDEERLRGAVAGRRRGRAGPAPRGAGPHRGGRPGGGPIAALPASQRFHWMVSPASTAVQPSEVHTGLCDDPAAALDRLFARLVE